VHEEVFDRKPVERLHGIAGGEAVAVIAPALHGAAFEQRAGHVGVGVDIDRGQPCAQRHERQRVAELTGLVTEILIQRRRVAELPPPAIAPPALDAAAADHRARVERARRDRGRFDAALAGLGLVLVVGALRLAVPPMIFLMVRRVVVALRRTVMAAVPVAVMPPVAAAWNRNTQHHCERDLSRECHSILPFDERRDQNPGPQTWL
jgi:hypothetical protein